MKDLDKIKQNKIIDNWIKETAKAYNKKYDTVQENEIISYLAQKELGYHFKNDSYCKDKEVHGSFKCTKQCNECINY